MFVRRLGRKIRDQRPDIAQKLDVLLSQSPTREAPLRHETISAIPVDTDSRLQLVRTEDPVALDLEPIWTDTVLLPLRQMVGERARQADLLNAGLHPTKSALFTGPPGVGKSLAARWIARELNRPLLTLDLSAVMSSFLGRTGVNVRHVLDYAKGTECVLFLDELDAVAKRRDDATEIGELKRLVTVLLQEIDDWPSSGILLAATNHSDLLDPAVWRRFDLIVEFPMPSESQVELAVTQFLPDLPEKDMRAALAVAMLGMSFSDIERELTRARREAITSGVPVKDRIDALISQRASQMPQKERKALATALVRAGLSMRRAEGLTGVHRQTISGAMSHHGEVAVAEG